MHEGPNYIVLTDGGAAHELVREALDDKSVRVVTDLLSSVTCLEPLMQPPQSSSISRPAARVS